MGGGRLARQIAAWNAFHRRRFYGRLSNPDKSAQRRFKERHDAAWRATRRYECDVQRIEWPRYLSREDLGWLPTPEIRLDMKPLSCCDGHGSARNRNRRDRLGRHEEQFERARSVLALRRMRLARSGRSLAPGLLDEICPVCRRFAYDCKRVTNTHGVSAVTPYDTIGLEGGRGVIASASFFLPRNNGSHIGRRHP